MRKALLVLLTAVCLGASAWLLLPGEAETGRSLASLERIDDRRRSELGSPSGTVDITLNGAQLPYDAAENMYLVPHAGDIEGIMERLQPALRDGWQYFLYETGNGSVTVYGINGDECASSDIVFTSLPVICITTDEGELPDEDDMDGDIIQYSPQNGHIIIEYSPIEINLRGNTSKRLPKKSYRVKIVDEEGLKQNLSLAGLRSDDDWILNPMYADTSKIRERLAYDLWAGMNSSGTVAASSRLEYAELFVNGRYWGLYGVQERVDRKQVDADRRSGLLWKVAANDRPSVEELRACLSGYVCAGFELEFSGEGVADPWEPLTAYMATLDGSEIETDTHVDLNNVIDYGLWAMFAQAHDCHFKNQFIHGVRNGGGYTLYKLPWDLNNTFGDVWSNESIGTNYTEYRIGSLVMDGSFERLVGSGDPEIYAAIRRRWAQLRAEIINADVIIEYARGLHSEIFPAIQRDTARWPQCGMGEGNAMNIRDIESYINNIIPRMDTYISGLGMDE